MAKLYDADGNEVEALTPEEFEAKKGEIETSLRAEAATKEADFQKQITDLGAKLEEAGLTDGQKKRLKEDKEAAEKLLEQVKSETAKQIGDLEAKIFSGQKSKLISGVAKDEDTRGKIAAKVDTLMKTGEYANDEEGIARAVTDAATLINGARPAPGFLDGISGAGERGQGFARGGNGEESESSKAQRKLLGISDEEAKTFAPKN